jgi:sugar lactone lactonase YvrE
VTTIAGAARRESLYSNVILASDRSGAYFASMAGGTVNRIDLQNGTVALIAGVAQTYGPGAQTVDGVGGAARFGLISGLTSDGHRGLLVTEENDWAHFTGIRHIDVATATVTTLSKLPTANFISDGGDNLYYAENRTLNVYRTTLSGDGTSKIATLPRFPEDKDLRGLSLALDGAGHLYVANADDNRIERVDLASGNVIVLNAAGPGSADGPLAQATFNRPAGIAFDSAGRLWVADSENATLRRIDFANGLANGLANATVTTVVGVTGQHGIKLGALPAGLNRPSSIAFTPNGDLLIAGSESESAILILRNP